MTLQEWSIRFDRVINSGKNGAFWLPDSFSFVEIQETKARNELWNLSDYIVSSVSGGTIWLIPHNEISRAVRDNRYAIEDRWGSVENSPWGEGE